MVFVVEDNEGMRGRLSKFLKGSYKFRGEATEAASPRGSITGTTENMFGHA